MKQKTIPLEWVNRMRMLEDKSVANYEVIWKILKKYGEQEERRVYLDLEKGRKEQMKKREVMKTNENFIN